MPHPLFNNQEIARRGKELYEQHIRALVDKEENHGKIVSIDIETGAFCIDEDLLRAAESLHTTHPGASVWSERIGYDAVYALGGGSITRLASSPTVGKSIQ